MGLTPHSEHTCNAYCRGNRHADVFWTSVSDEQMDERAGALMDHFGLRLVHWEPAPEARWPGSLAVRYDSRDGSRHGGYCHPDERPVLLVWEVSPQPAGVLDRLRSVPAGNAGA